MVGALKPAVCVFVMPINVSSFTYHEPIRMKAIGSMIGLYS